MMKKFWQIGLLLIGVIAIGWFFISQRPDDGVSDDSKLQITVSMPLLRDLTEEIGGEAVAVDSIINGPNCNHQYEPASGDLIKVSKSALFIKIGMGFDRWAEKLAKTAGNNVTVIDASQGVIPIVSGEADHEDHKKETEHEEHGTEGDHQEEDHHHELVNPHYWGDPENVKIMAGNILEGLCKALPEKEAYFTHNYQAYLEKVDRTATALKAQLNKAATKQIVSYSAAFPYLYHYFGLENLETVETTCEQEVSPKRLAEVTTSIRANRVKVIIGEAVYPKLPENLAKDTGAKLVLLWPATNESGDYLETLKENVEKLIEALR